MMTMTYHKPVLLSESVDALDIHPNGWYVDATYGGGGHSKEILSRLSDDGKLFAFDQDADALLNEIDDPRLVIIPNNFRFLKNNMRFYGVEGVDGILADLGVSSHQFNEGERGFSTRFDGPLDMRMNQAQKLDAKKVINEYSEEELADIFYEYGELRDARKIASIIVHQRKTQPIETTQQLASLFDFIPFKKRNKYLAQIFQALRIYVNDEINALKDLLVQSLEVLKVGGNMVVISYHSLEDRLVKNYFRNGMFEGEPEKDVFGNWYSPWILPKKKLVVPTEQEIEENPRARSAKMRSAKKNHEKEHI